MVIVKLSGGLGDQMFQYAAALGIAHEGETVYADLHALFGSDPSAREGYRLTTFPALHFPKIPNLVHRIFNSPYFPWPILRGLLRPRFRRVSQQGSGFRPGLHRRKRSLYLDGPFRNPEYFEKRRAQLLAAFAFPEPDEERSMLAGAIASHRDAVSIGIRRGPDEENPAPEGPSMQYYTECIRRLRQSSAQLHFYVFTNDTHWSRQQLKLDETEATFVQVETTGPETLHLMTQCAHHITAGNADDWWGAWLSQRNGLYFIPTEWTGQDTEGTQVANVAPEGWSLVPAR